jgi:DNA end-binding protein Ku
VAKKRTSTQKHSSPTADEGRPGGGKSGSPATVWKGLVSFGLVSFPVRLHSAARGERVQFHMLHKKDLSRVHEVWFCNEEEKQVDRADLVKGFETSKGSYVVVEDEELKKIAPPTAQTMDIVQFVQEDEVDPIYFEASYYVAPESASSKPYSLFFAALKETKQYAIAKVAMHNREHVVLMRPSEGALVLHTLFYSNELHKSNKKDPPKSAYSAKELELAKTLIKHLSGPFKPQEFEDTYRENVERLIQEKSKGKKITTVEQPRKAPVIDLMEALKKSLQSGSAKHSETKKQSGGKKRRAA